jgi:hypothetical protein
MEFFFSNSFKHLSLAAEYELQISELAWQSISHFSVRENVETLIKGKG